MGSTCNKTKVDSSTKDSKSRVQYVAPEPINEIAGSDVNRSHALYQYALFCVTRLIDKYKFFMFPDVSMSLESFREDLEDFLAVLFEVYNDLAFEERTMQDSRVDEEACALAKNAISELSLMFLHMSEAAGEEGEEKAGEGVTEIKQSEPTGKEIEERYTSHKQELQLSADFETCYGDTLKMLFTDLERKEIWHMDTLFSNKEFQEQLKVKEPATHESLLKESVMIQVPCKPTDTAADTAATDTGTAPEGQQKTDQQPEKEEIVMRNQGLV